MYFETAIRVAHGRNEGYAVLIYGALLSTETDRLNIVRLLNETLTVGYQTSRMRALDRRRK